MATQTDSTGSTRWNLVISDQTNIAVRSFLAQRGFKKGDLSSFVEEAVRWRVFDQMLAQAREGFAAMEPQDAQSLFDEAVAKVRAEGLAAGKYDAFKSRAAPATPLTRRKRATSPSKTGR
jgi:hypothetical protein